MMNDLPEVISSQGSLYSLTNTKLIIAGSKCELMTYEKPIVYNLSPKLQKQRRLTGSREKLCSKGNPKKKHKNNIKRSMDNLRRKINANFDSVWTAFVTLTFGEDINDIVAANQYFSRFTNRVRPHYPGIRYIACPEIHEERQHVLHYHMLYCLNNEGFIPVNLEVVKSWQSRGFLDRNHNPNVNLTNLWGHGSVHARRLRAQDFGLTFTRYMAQATENLNVFNKKAYIASKNLADPVTLYGDEALRYVLSLNLVNTEPVYSTSYQSEYVGQITHTFFDLSLSTSVA